MRFNIKKYISCGIVAVMLISITACSNNSENNQSSLSSVNSASSISSSISSSGSASELSSIADESSTTSIPDKYKLEAPIGSVGTTEPEYFDELGVFVTDKYKLYLGSGWSYECAYDDYTSVYGYTNDSIRGAVIVNISEEPDLPSDGQNPLDYYQSIIESTDNESSLKEASTQDVNGVTAYCFWYENPTNYLNTLYAFYNTDQHTYQVAGTLYESPDAFDILNSALATFEPLE